MSIATRINTLAELFTHDYSTIFGNVNEVDRFYSLFVHPAVPLLAVTAYWFLSSPIFAGIRTMFGVQPKGAALQWLVIVHSAVLAVYSGWTCYYSWKIVIPHMMKHGVYTTFCDVDGSVWHAGGLGFWITHFYLSKFYEFIDTWIIMLKGREPIFLQTYHHAGIVIFMWSFVITNNTCGGIAVICLNSFIHTLMYTYYTLAAFGYKSPLKNYLTQAQIIQFLIGIGLTVPAHFMPGCLSEAQSASNAGIQVYAVVLILLFAQFYAANYTKKGSKKGEKKLE